MDFDTHVHHLGEQGLALADSARAAGLDAPVPTCPEWTMRDLLTHQGQVHRWAHAYVATGRTTPPNDDDRPAEPPADDELLLEWFRIGHDELVRALKDAPADLDCWSFLPAPSPREFWARRQAHETTIHGVDAARAAGRTTAIDPMLAADGIDELLNGFFARARGSLVSDPPRALAVVARDVDAAWTMTIGADRRTTAPGADPAADATVSGDATALYLLLWNRGDREGVDVDGDASLLDLWRDKAQIRWA